VDDLNYDLLKEELPAEAFERVKPYYVGKYSSPPIAEYRKLNDQDLALVQSKLKDYFATFHLSGDLYEEVLDSYFTVITTRPSKAGAEASAEE